MQKLSIILLLLVGSLAACKKEDFNQPQPEAKVYIQTVVVNGIPTLELTFTLQSRTPVPIGKERSDSLHLQVKNLTNDSLSDIRLALQLYSAQTKQESDLLLAHSLTYKKLSAYGLSSNSLIYIRKATDASLLQLEPEYWTITATIGPPTQSLAGNYKGEIRFFSITNLQVPVSLSRLEGEISSVRSLKLVLLDSVQVGFSEVEGVIGIPGDFYGTLRSIPNNTTSYPILANGFPNQMLSDTLEIRMEPTDTVPVGSTDTLAFFQATLIRQ